MNGIMKLFANSRFGEVRVLETNTGDIMFCASDVAKALGYARPNNAIKKHCRYTLKRGIPHPQSKDKLIEMLFIPESDVYRLSFRSKLPDAVDFADLVSDEVLPSIRKHGVYMTDEALQKYIENSDYTKGIIDQLVAERLSVKSLETKCSNLNSTVKMLTEQIEESKGMVDLAKQISFSSDTISVGELAKLLNKNGIDTGRDRLFKWLRTNGYLTSTGKHRNIPTQKSVNLGVLTLNETSYLKKDGTHGIGFTPRVTVKGQEYFLKIFLKGKK
jgi:anti-repressor protein